MLRERPFRLLFIGQSVSLLGDGMVSLALAFAVLELGGSASDLGLVLAAQTVALVALLLFGGVVADRLPRRGLMIGADVTRAVSQGAMGALLIAGVAQLWMLAALVALTGGATALFNPASTGLTPSVVSAAGLQQANALRGLAMSGGRIAGPALAGALVAGLGAGWALAVDAATFVVSAAFLSRMPRPAHVALPPQTFLRDLRDGWAEFTRRTWVWSVVLVASVGNTFNAALWVLGPVVAKKSLGGAGAWAVVLAVDGLGALAGGLLALRVRPRRPLVVAAAVMMAAALPLAALALELPVWMTALGAGAGGAGAMIFNTLWETALQRHVPDAALSRVSAYDWFGSLALAPVGMAIWGPVAVAVGMSEALWIAAALIVVSNVAMLAVPSVRGLRDDVPVGA